ncbi:MAG TPA: AraC family transcriptional regulator [Burkholderiaceae bacterium]
MSARIVPLIASAVLVLLHAAVWAADKPAAAQPAAPSPVAATPGAAPAAAASAPLGAKASETTAVAPAAAPGNLDTRIQDLKGDVIRLNRDLLVLEEELLFPANTQVAVFVSMDVGKLFELDSVQIKLDDKVVTNYLYTPMEVQALHRGGVQRVYLGNLKAGTHEIVAFFTGGGPHERDYKRGATVKFDKGTDPKYIELRIKDSSGKLQPEFDVKIWQ